jgi:hypothetical protein
LVLALVVVLALVSVWVLFFSPPSPLWLLLTFIPPSFIHPHPHPQIPHYHLRDATAAIKPLLGPYYREPAKSPGPLPLHLIAPLARSFKTDQ